VPRQNGKNGIIEMRELYGLVELGERFLHTAHEVKTARKAFIRLASFFEDERNYPELAALVKEIRRTNGQEAIVLTNGGSVEFVARSKGSGRGFTVDTLVMDEAQELSDDALEALMPTTSAAPLGNPQWVLTGTPPGPSAAGEVFTRTRREALSGLSTRLCWHEWSCVGEVDLDDRSEWERANPALGMRLQADVLEGERARFSDGGFARERLGMWQEEESHLRVIPSDTWGALADDGPADPTPPSALAVDMSHDRVIAIAGCWVVEDSAHVELVAVDRAQETLAAVEWLVARARRRIPVVVDSVSPAASMVPALKSRGVRVIQTSAADMGKACGLFFDDVMAGRLTHAAQAQLDDALAGAKKRNIRDAGAWAWDRKNAETNIAPLVAATLARYGASLNIRTKTGRVVTA
jgi:hypothetical protein